MDTGSQITAKDKCINSIWTTVSYYYMGPSQSISVVPENLKKWNEDAYKPKVVSIGPRFNGTIDECLLMEVVKASCMWSLLYRISDTRSLNSTAYDTLKECVNVVWELDEAVRASYSLKFELGREELTKIMIVDGCFLLELLLIKRFLSNDPYSTSTSLAAVVLKDETVLSDLMLFENQIPIMVLHMLSKILTPEVLQLDDNKINNLALSVLGYSPLEFLCPQAHHILDLVHFFVNRSTIESTTQSQQDDHIMMDNIHTTQSQQQQLKLKRCALRLLTSGVTIKAKLSEDSKTTDSGALSCFSWVWNGLCAIMSWLFFVKVNKHLENEDYIHELKGLNFFFKFEKGKLEIEQLHITKTTKAKWCNVIASEHHQSKTTSSESGRGGGGKFTLAALIFNGLICSADDVQLLKDKKVVVDHLKMTNQELMDFFRKIELGVDHGVVNSSNYIQMVNDINNFSKAFLIKRIWSTVLNSFTYRQEWLFRFLNRNYNFVATVLSILTVVQTVYSILAYYFPK